MDDSRAQQSLPFEPPVQRVAAAAAEPETEREIGLDQLTGLLFEELVRRSAGLDRR